MNHNTKKDLRLRKQVAEAEVERRWLLSMINNQMMFSLYGRNLIRTLFQMRFGPNTSPVRVVNRCIWTGRSHSVYRFGKISRLEFRRLAGAGFLQGWKKHSW